MNSTDAPVFLITGGSRGIGEAVALSAARAGYFVLLTYLSNRNAADSVVARIRERAGEPEEVAATVMSLASDEAAYVSGAILAVGGGR